jgi:drug/metabolite transporter (DMT)-like permease
MSARGEPIRPAHRTAHDREFSITSEAMPADDPRTQAYTLLPIIVVVWGINWPLMKVGLHYITPLWMSAARVGLGATCLFAFLAWTRRLAIPTRRDLPVVLSVAFFQMVLFLSLTNFGLRHVPAGRSAVLVYTTPLWVTPGAVLFLGERLGPMKVLGLVCGIMGVVELFNPAALDWSHPDVVVGSGLLMLASFCWGISLLHIRGHRWHLSPLQLTPWQLLLALLLLVPTAAIFDGVSGVVHWNATLVTVLVYNGPIATAFSFWAGTSIARALPAITSSLSFLAVPIVGVLSSDLMLGEIPDPSLLIGFGLILVGVVIVNVADFRR